MKHERKTGNEIKLFIGLKSLDKPFMGADTPLNDSHTQATLVWSTHVHGSQKNIA
jgi:hypothetical protein